MIKFVICFFIVVLLMPTSTSAMSNKYKNQDILSKSGIKVKSYNKVFQDIKKDLSNNLDNCDIKVLDIKLIRKQNESVLEDWTVDVCGQEKVYLISTYNPKGYFCTATPKEKIFKQQEKIWNYAKQDGTEDEWRDVLFYIDEIEAKNRSENNRGRSPN